MSQFSLSALEDLAFDFTGFPRNDGKGNCTGKGVIPEPTQAHLTAYAEGMKKLYDAESDPEKIAAQADKDLSPRARDAATKKRARQLLALTSALCQGTPTTDELEELPPRVLTAFFKWVRKELSDPEVLSGDTPL